MLHLSLGTASAQHFLFSHLEDHPPPQVSGAPLTLCVDPARSLAAVGDGTGLVRIVGKEGIVGSVRSRDWCPVIFASFVPGGGLVTVSAEGTVEKFELGPASPPGAKAQSATRLPSRDARISAVHFPPRSRFAFVGSSRGNLFLLNAEGSSIAFSSWVIGTEKASKDGKVLLHKAAVMAIESCPHRRAHVLVGYALGLIVLFDVKDQSAVFRIDYLATQDLRSLAWHPGGALFAVGLNDGRVAVWAKKGDPKQPLVILNQPEKLDSPLRRPITRLVWLADPKELDEDSKETKGMANPGHVRNFFFLIYFFCSHNYHHCDHLIFIFIFFSYIYFLFCVQFSKLINPGPSPRLRWVADRAAR
jgi:WD40 repeat protein